MRPKKKLTKKAVKKVVKKTVSIKTKKKTVKRATAPKVKSKPVKKTIAKKAKVVTQKSVLKNPRPRLNPRPKLRTEPETSLLKEVFETQHPEMSKEVFVEALEFIAERKPSEEFYEANDPEDESEDDKEAE